MTLDLLNALQVILDEMIIDEGVTEGKEDEMIIFGCIYSFYNTNGYNLGF